MKICSPVCVCVCVCVCVRVLHHLHSNQVLASSTPLLEVLPSPMFLVQAVLEGNKSERAAAGQLEQGGTLISNELVSNIFY